MKKSKKTVIVLGNPRSGTSTIAGILDILGVNLNGNKEKHPVVPKGSFEDGDFAMMDKKILEGSFGSCNENAFWLKLPESNQILNQRRIFDSEIKSLISKKFEEDLIQGWKYPETMLTIELYLAHITNPHLVIILRNPLDIAKSMIKFHKLKKINLNVDFLQILKIINERNKRMMQSLQKYPDIPKIFISFEDLVFNSIKESQKIADFLGIDLSSNKVRKIKKFVIPNNRIIIERKKASINILIRKNRLLRFIKKCIIEPSKIPSFIQLLIANNIRKQKS